MSEAAPEMRPPEPPSAVAWARKNLFNSWFNGIVSIALLVAIAFATVAAVDWVVYKANWRPVAEFPFLYMVGQYPRDELWRIGLSMSLLAIAFGLSWGSWGGLVRSFAISLGGFFAVVALLPVRSSLLNLSNRAAIFGNILLILLAYRLGMWKRVRGWYVFVIWFLFAGMITLVLLPGFAGSNVLPAISTTVWGGLLVTLILAAGGIILSFPIGVLLALGRRSSLPVLKGFCITFIEVVRGVPLVTILFMFSIILQLFLPPEARIDRLIRALMAMTFFSAAYTAENVRGGLQAIPQGQVEAAQAVGLSRLQITGLIVLPQALRKVIPAIVGQFITLFKDTTLVIIVGINELLGIGKSILNTDPSFVRAQAEVYLFVALVFWAFSYVMSHASRQLEAALGVGER
jgi:general L-amino acid transport system permease protein